MHTDEEIISGYLLHCTGDESYFWAFVEICELVNSDTERAWNMTCEMIRRTKDEQMLADIAAGPLEDILDGYGDSYIEQAEKFARQDVNFRKALSEVWITPDQNPDIYARVQKACGKR